MTQQEIADKFGVHRQTIQNWFRKHGIETDWTRDPTHPPHHKFNRRHDTVGSMYEQVATSMDGVLHTVSIHRLVAYAHGVIDAEEFFDSDTVVHHKTGHGLDNRPENLEKMGRGEHMAHHHEERRAEGGIGTEI